MFWEEEPIEIDMICENPGYSTTIVLSAMPSPESLPNTIELTPEQLLEQGICPCGSTDSKNCNITGCALACYNGEFDDPTPYCNCCGAMKKCNCPPRAEND